MIVSLKKEEGTGSRFEDGGRVVLTGNHFVTWTTTTLPAPEHLAFVDWLVDTTEHVVLVVFWLFPVVVIVSSSVFLLGRGRRRGRNLLLDLIDHLTALHPSPSDDFHFSFRDGRSSYSLAGIDCHKLLSSHQIEVASGSKVRIWDVGVFFLN